MYEKTGNPEQSARVSRFFPAAEDRFRRNKGTLIDSKQDYSQICSQLFTGRFFKVFTIGEKRRKSGNFSCCPPEIYTGKCE